MPVLHRQIYLTGDTSAEAASANVPESGAMRFRLLRPTAFHGSALMNGRCSVLSHACMAVVRTLQNEPSAITKFAMASSFGA